MSPRRERPLVLYLGNSAAYALTHRRAILDGLRAHGLDVQLVLPERGDVLDALVGSGEDSLAPLRALGFAVHTVPLQRGGRGPVAEARLLARLVALYRSLRPDLVLHATLKPVLVGGVAARLAGVPAALSTLTGLGHTFLSEAPRERALRAVIGGPLRFALGHPRGLVVVQNADDARALVEGGLAARDRVRLVPGSGVDAAAFSPVPEPEGPPVVVLPARLLWDKGVGEFVEAARQLRAAGSRARFALVGDVDPENPASISPAVLDAWAAEGAVERWGWRRDMRDVLASATVVCLPSYREGVPKALLEAMAMGRPFVTTDVPGCREVAHGGSTGLVVPKGHAARLAEALGRLLDDPALRARLGAEGRRQVEARYEKSRVVAAFVAAADELLRGAA